MKSYRIVVKHVDEYGEVDRQHIDSIHASADEAKAYIAERWKGSQSGFLIEIEEIEEPEAKSVSVNFDKHSHLAQLCPKCKADPTEALCPDCTAVAQNLCFNCKRVVDYPTTEPMIHQCGYRIFDDAGNLCWPCPCFKSHEEDTVIELHAGGLAVNEVIDNQFDESNVARNKVEAQSENDFTDLAERIGEDALERSLDRKEFMEALKVNPDLVWESWLEERNACRHRSAPKPETLLDDDKVSQLRRAIAEARAEALAEKELQFQIMCAEERAGYKKSSDMEFRRLKLVIGTQVEYLKIEQPLNERS